MTYFLTQDKLYIYVPFSKKDEAKELGAKYDSELKLWYMPPVKDPLQVEEFWAFLENTYDDKEQLKRMGVKFHPKIKKWFVPNTCQYSYSYFIKWWPENLKRFLLSDKYQIFRRISSGGQATVYQVLDLNDYGLYAAKIFNEQITDQDTKKKNSDFQKEMSALDKLNRENHDNIISVRDYGQIEETGQYYIISKFCDYNLDDWIESTNEEVLEKYYFSSSKTYEHEETEEEFVKRYLSEGFNLSDKDAVQILMFPILEALVFCHRNNIYHRDVKPSNILIDFDIEEDGIKPKLCDFGISKNTLNKSTDTYTRVDWSSNVWSPSNISNEDEVVFQHTRDIYGWAASTIAFINRKIPEKDEELRLMLKSPSSLKFDKRFINLLKLGIEKKAEERPQDIEDYKVKIAEFLFKE